MQLAAQPVPPTRINGRFHFLSGRTIWVGLAAQLAPRQASENAHAFLRLSTEPSHVDKLDRTLAVLSTIFYVQNRSWRSKALVQNIVSIRSNLLLVNQACRTGHTKMHGRLPEKSSRAGAAAHSRELGDYILGGAMQPGNRL